MAISLQKGERVAVGQHVHVTVGLGWDPAESGQTFDLDASAALIGANKKVPDDKFFVFYNNLQSSDGAVKSTGDDRTGGNSETGDDEQVIVDLPKVSPQVAEIIFSASIHEAAARKQNFGQVQNAYIRIFDTDSNEEMYRYDLSEDYSSETAIEFGRLYRKDGEWKFQATGVGYKTGLQGIVDKYT